LNAPKVEIGPHSVGKNLTSKALCFGGDTLTLTDAALIRGYADIKEADLGKISLSQASADAIFVQVCDTIARAVVSIQGESAHLPILFVGGGAALLPPEFLKERGQIPPYFHVANAYGAALSEIAGTVDTVISLQNREEALQKLYAEARERAVLQGADPSDLRLVDQQIIPYHYVPNQMARVMVRFCGKRK
jgi:N-methylhydantoinase A/oxoprolinase/acetone carboxylase beta subunit